MIVIEGMGWFGAMTALAFEREGIPFWWYDPDFPFNAWEASTGIVYPAGDDRSERNRQAWFRWMLEGWLPPYTTRRVAYGYAHKSPPHEGRYQPNLDLGWLRVSPLSAVAVGVQALVHEARRRFASRRLAGPSDRDQLGSPRVIAWTPPGVRIGWVWGWSRQVALFLPPELARLYGTNLSLYGKVNRWALTYAYPVGDKPDWWWAGSSLVNEKRPRLRSEEELRTCYKRWAVDFSELFPGVEVRAGREQEIQQGWRPKPPKMDAGYPRVDEQLFVYPALWHSGVRWAPELVEGCISWARECT